MSIRLKLFIGFLILILIFIADFFVNQRLSREVIRNSEYLNKSETIIQNSNRLHKNMIDMQSSFRGFLLTNKTIFLEPFYDGIKSVPPLITEQRRLITSQHQTDLLDTIEVLHKKWIEYSQALIQSKLDTLPESNVRFQELFDNKMKAEVGIRLNDQIRNHFQEFDATEYQVRINRREALQNSIRETRNITLFLTLFSISVALLATFFIIRTIPQRISMMVKQAEEISRGKFVQIKDNTNDELKRLSESLNSMSETLNKNFIDLTLKNKELDQFAYVVSHDLKAPLRGISNIINWMEEDHHEEITPAIQKNIELIKGRTARLEKMINGLLEYARVGKVKKDVEVVDLNQLLPELADILVPPSFMIEIDEDLPVLITEKIRLEQVFSNILSNSVKYHHRKDGKISISYRETEGFHEFSIADDGPGIEKEYHEKIFVIFQTLRERDAFESTGVGLAIVKKILDDMQANIQVESTPGKGTSFIFTWPKNTMRESNAEKTDAA